MSKKGICIHCLTKTDSITKDHVFPKSWYPSSTPANIERWTAPSCRPCNLRHGKNEEDLLLRIGLCLGPDEFAAQGVSSRMMRMVQPELGRTPRDKAARAKKLEKLLCEVKVVDDPNVKGVFPNFGPQEGVDYPEYSTIEIHESGLKMLGEKIARGVQFKVTGELITKKQHVYVFFNRDEDIQDILKTILRQGETLHRGPGIIVSRTGAKDSPETVFFHIQIWGRLKINVGIVPIRLKKRLQDAERAAS